MIHRLSYTLCAFFAVLALIAGHLAATYVSAPLIVLACQYAMAATVCAGIGFLALWLRFEMEKFPTEEINDDVWGRIYH